VATGTGGGTGLGYGRLNFNVGNCMFESLGVGNIDPCPGRTKHLILKYDDDSAAFSAGTVHRALYTVLCSLHG
jgi:hypothetical protein